jgi:hypothetical protein
LGSAESHLVAAAADRKSRHPPPARRSPSVRWARAAWPTPSAVVERPVAQRIVGALGEHAGARQRIVRRRCSSRSLGLGSRGGCRRRHDV